MNNLNNYETHFELVICLSFIGFMLYTVATIF